MVSALKNTQAKVTKVNVKSVLTILILMESGNSQSFIYFQF